MYKVGQKISKRQLKRAIRWAQTENLVLFFQTNMFSTDVEICQLYKEGKSLSQMNKDELYEVIELNKIDLPEKNPETGKNWTNKELKDLIENLQGISHEPIHEQEYIELENANNKLAENLNTLEKENKAFSDTIEQNNETIEKLESQNKVLSETCLELNQKIESLTKN